jgi:hypothetical protein
VINAFGFAFKTGCDIGGLDDHIVYVGFNVLLDL